MEELKRVQIVTKQETKIEKKSRNYDKKLNF